MDYYNFYTGREFEAYRFLGAHVEGDTVLSLKHISEPTRPHYN